MSVRRRTPPTLPPELWLQILERATIQEAEHLWTSVREVSQFRDYVERLFKSTYLSKYAISLSLPRRDPATGSLKWPGEIPRHQFPMSFDSILSDQRFAVFASPRELRNRQELKSMEEMRDLNVLPLQRLIEASAWVYTTNNYTAGVTVELEKNIEWNEVRKVWIWQIDWRDLISRFYKMKEEARRKTSTARHTQHHPISTTTRR